MSDHCGVGFFLFFKEPQTEHFEGLKSDPNDVVIFISNQQSTDAVTNTCNNDESV